MSTPAAIASGHTCDLLRTFEHGLPDAQHLELAMIAELELALNVPQVVATLAELWFVLVAHISPRSTRRRVV
jgi:hypothetical protein